MACTFEHNGQWYTEEGLLELYNSGNLFSLENTPSSKASPTTLKKIKEWLGRLNVPIKDLDTQRYNGVNGMANLLESVISIAQGKENVSLPEEAMHFAVEILKQTKSPLYIQMLNKIGSYQIYKDMLNDNSPGSYKNTYLTKEGKPDILKLKEEAVGKVLAEYYIQKEEGSTEKPELLVQVQTWWEELLQWFRSLIKKAQFNPFQQAIETIDNLNTYTPSSTASTFLQKENTFADSLINKIEDTNKQYNLRKIVEKDLENEDEVKNLYLVDRDGKTDVETDRTTNYAKKENLKNTGGIDYFAKRTEEQLKSDKTKANYGVGIHSSIENIIEQSTENGYLIKNENVQNKFNINKGIFNSLLKFLLGDESIQGFLQQFPEGTKFITEKTIYNPFAGKTGRAGTVDLCVIPPKEENKKQKILIYDWKSMGFDLRNNPDIPKNKRQQHAIQLADYKNTIKKLFSPEEQKDIEILGQTIPIHATYKYNPEKIPILQSIKIGKVNIKDENNTYLLPVLAKDQSTGNLEVDSLIRKLEGHYKKIFQGAESEEEKLERKQDAAQLSIAIRQLQIKMNFEPIAQEAKSFQSLVKATLEKYKASKDPEILKELRDLAHSAEIYTGIDEVFVSEYGTENLGDQEKTYNALKTVSRDTSLLLKQLLAKEAEILETLAQDTIQQTILTPEVEVKGLISSVTEPNSVGNKTISLFLKLLNTARGNEAQTTKALYSHFLDLFFKAGGQSVYSKIAQQGKMELVEKVSPEFKESLKKARKDGDTKFFQNNVNKETAQALIDERIAAQTSIINERESINYYNEDEELNKKEANRLRKSLETKLNLYAKGFDGFDDRGFLSIFWKSLEINETNQSKEYAEIKKDENILNLYDLIREINYRAKQNGYLKKYTSLNFLPLITGSTLEQLNSSSNSLSTLKNTLKDSFIVQINEEKQFGKTGDSGKQENTIPTYFTRTDKEYQQLSKDLPKIFEKYIESLIAFETNKNLESIGLSLLALEKNKDHFEVINNKVVFEGENPKPFTGNELNFQFLEKNVFDALYGIQENNNTWVDIAVKKIKKGSQEEKERTALSTKKTIENANTLTQSLAVGLRALVTIPNYVGAHLQSTINAGGYYKGREYEKNHLKIIGTAFSSKEKNKALAAIDHFIPLNDDVAKDVRKDVLYKNDKLAWLKTWSFRDIMMFSNRLPDKAHELTNALSWLSNTIIRDNKYVNIRQWLRSQPEYQNRYQDPTTLKEKEREFEQKVEELKKESLIEQTTFNENGEPTIPHASNYGEYRTKMLEYGRKNTGQMSRDNKADYRRSIIGRSFSMFKNWIIPQVQVRALDINKNVLTDEWEYGRLRLYLKTLAHLGFKSFLKIKDIKQATPEGIRIMREILDQKREDYFLKTGQELTISEAEFFDMMRKELISETKELRMLLGLAALVLSAKLAAPDDDDDKNLYNTALKAVSKIYDEIGFYYNPLSIDSIQKGSILPSFGLVSKAYRALTAIGEESFGYLSDNEELIEDAKPLKYTLNLIPFASQFQNDILPIIDPEGARSMGIKISPIARQGQ